MPLRCLSFGGAKLVGLQVVVTTAVLHVVVWWCGTGDPQARPPGEVAAETDAGWNSHGSVDTGV